MKPPIFFGLPPDQVTDQHPGLIVMVCGPSHVGKTYACEHIIAPRLGAAFLSIDLLYSEAVMRAGMTARTGDHYSVELIRARSLARDRKWEAGQEKAFFDAYARLIEDAMRAAPGALLLDGGTLSREEEARIVLKVARQVHNKTERLIRLWLTPPYQQWLANRIKRQASLGVATEKIANLVESTYEKRREAAQPPPVRGISDLRVSTPTELDRIVGAAAG
jgi:hypothetical protein